MTELIEGTYVNAAGVRNYKLYTTLPLQDEAPPLFVMLHGCDQDAAGFAARTRMNELAEEFHAVVLYPEQCRMINPMGCWNWHDIRHQSAAQGEPSLIAGMTRQVMGERGIGQRESTSPAYRRAAHRSWSARSPSVGILARQRRRGAGDHGRRHASR